MTTTSQIISIFLNQLACLPDFVPEHHDLVLDILAPALDREKDLRVLFAQEPNHPALTDPFTGLIDIFETSPLSRRAHPRPTRGLHIGYSFVENHPCLFPENTLLPLHSHMRRTQGTPAVVESLERFVENLDVFTHGALSKITDWNNVVLAGGSVLACLCPLSLDSSNLMLNKFFQSNAYADSDVDLFLWGLSSEQAKRKMKQIYNDIQSAIPWTTVCVRKTNTITIYTSFPTRPIQIVLRLYRSPAQIVTGFDIDGASCLYDGRRVYVTPRALAACIRQSNTIDMTRCSPSYEVHLAKYADRGFEVFFPELDRRHIDYSHLYDSELSSYPKGLARLIVLELIRRVPHHYPRIYRRKTVKNEFAILPNNPQPMDFKPVEKKLVKNNYDSSWIRIPYAPDWNAERVIRLVNDIDSRMNSGFTDPDDPTGSRRLHRHAVFCGTMDQCLGDFCPRCPIPTNDEEHQLIASESSKFIRGPVQFLETDAGRQMLSGSFNPIDTEDWSVGAYTDTVSTDVHSVYIRDTRDLEDDEYVSYVLTFNVEEESQDEESSHGMITDTESLSGHGGEYDGISEGSFHSFSEGSEIDID